MKLLITIFKKPFLSRIVFLAVLIGIAFFSKFSFNLPGGNTSNLATLFINLETEKRFFEGEVVEDMTILDALNLAISVGKIRLNYAIDESGNVNIMEIDGHINRVGNKYFVFYLNSKIVTTKDLNKEVIRRGDRIEIRNE